MTAIRYTAGRPSSSDTGSPAFTEQFDAGDARFIGKPIDYVVFDGCGDGIINRVVLLEVKTGSGRLTAIQRQVEAAVAKGRMRSVRRQQ